MSPTSGLDLDVTATSVVYAGTGFRKYGLVDLSKPPCRIVE